MTFHWPLIFVLLGAGGCAKILTTEEMQNQINLMKQHNPIGCAYIKGSGTPPASRVDGGVVGAWGEGMTPELMIACIEKVQRLAI